MAKPKELDDVMNALQADRDEDRPNSISWHAYCNDATEKWKALLGDDPSEKRVQEFLELNPAFIPGGVGDVGPGGHHGSKFGLVFTQPELKSEGPSFRPDFMWITRSSGLITPILIEIEKPSRRWFKSDGHPTADFSHAHSQLNDWRAWFERSPNQEIFRRAFGFADPTSMKLPIKPQYLLIYGRASEFSSSGPHRDPDSLLGKRDGQRTSDEFFRSFDSLKPEYGLSEAITAKLTPQGIKLHAFAPTFGTYANLSDGGLELGDPREAFERTIMMSEERKAYLARRWEHWMSVARTREEHPDHIYSVTLEVE